MPDYIFLSYDRADRSYVDSLVRQLVAEGIPYWIDQGMENDDEPSGFAEPLAGAAAVIVVVTPKAVASPRVNRAVRQARELGKPILPLVRRRAATTLLGDDLESEDVTGGGLPSAGFYERVRAHTGVPAQRAGPGAWQPQTRLPHRLGPIAKTRAETWGVRALLAATLFLAVAGIFSGDWNLFLVFPAFGIPDLLFAWFRRRRFRLPGRWSTDVRASILLTVLTLYLTFAAVTKLSASSSPFLVFGVPAAIVLGYAAAAVWIARAISDRPR
jgi:hypothetical protein